MTGRNYTSIINHGPGSQRTAHESSGRYGVAMPTHAVGRELGGLVAVNRIGLMHRWWRVIETTHQEENDISMLQHIMSFLRICTFLFVAFFNSPTVFFLFFFSLFRLRCPAQLLVFSFFFLVRAASHELASLTLDDIASGIRASVAPCIVEWIVVVCFARFHEPALDPFPHICPSLARSVPDLLVEFSSLLLLHVP